MKKTLYLLGTNHFDLMGHKKVLKFLNQTSPNIIFMESNEDNLKKIDEIGKTQKAIIKKEIKKQLKEVIPPVNFNLVMDNVINGFLKDIKVFEIEAIKEYIAKNNKAKMIFVEENYKTLDNNDDTTALFDLMIQGVVEITVMFYNYCMLNTKHLVKESFIEFTNISLYKEFLEQFKELFDMLENNPNAIKDFEEPIKKVVIQLMGTERDEIMYANIAKNINNKDDNTYVFIGGLLHSIRLQKAFAKNNVKDVDVKMVMLNEVK